MPIAGPARGSADLDHAEGAGEGEKHGLCSRQGYGREAQAGAAGPHALQPQYFVLFGRGDGRRRPLLHAFEGARLSARTLRLGGAHNHQGLPPGRGAERVAHLPLCGRSWRGIRATEGLWPPAVDAGAALRRERRAALVAPLALGPLRLLRHRSDPSRVLLEQPRGLHFGIRFVHPSHRRSWRRLLPGRRHEACLAAGGRHQALGVHTVLEPVGGHEDPGLRCQGRSARCPLQRDRRQAAEDGLLLRRPPCRAGSARYGPGWTDGPVLHRPRSGPRARASRRHPEDHEPDMDAPSRAALRDGSRERAVTRQLLGGQSKSHAADCGAYQRLRPEVRDSRQRQVRVGGQHRGKARAKRGQGQSDGVQDAGLRGREGQRLGRRGVHD
mmetsp:Transcript_110287/g.317255  ORF Transcript_110287/g.317255 Transcript_110287/m.317255 type:complete len:384 (+) Transcript_110287:1252-2403(+)